MSENLASSGPRVNTHAPDLTLSTMSGLERRISHGHLLSGDGEVSVTLDSERREIGVEEVSAVHLS